jgi:bifunctional non-homologous end joining protein LigD
MLSEFVVHHHRTGRSHFDLRVVEGPRLRSWSILKAPPRLKGERRLAIERENFPAESIRHTHFDEQAFGFGRVNIWDSGKVEIVSSSERHLVLIFMGSRLSGEYEFRRMFWYPGNRWIIAKLKEPGS